MTRRCNECGTEWEAPVANCPQCGLIAPLKPETEHPYADKPDADLLAYGRSIVRGMKSNGYSGIVWDEVLKRFDKLSALSHVAPPVLGECEECGHTIVTPLKRLRPDLPPVDVERVKAWFYSKPRQKAEMAFTAGEERQLAYMLEDAAAGIFAPSATRQSILEEAAKVCDALAKMEVGSRDWKKFDEVTAGELAHRIRLMAATDGKADANG